jgi:hypothetical protein
MFCLLQRLERNVQVGQARPETEENQTRGLLSESSLISRYSFWHCHDTSAVVLANIGSSAGAQPSSVILAILATLLFSLFLEGRISSGNKQSP